MSRHSAVSSPAHLKKQLALLKKSESSGEPLAEILFRSGWSYEDLVYETSGLKAWSGGGPPALQDLRAPSSIVPLVSFFTGCGGMDLGLEAAGYRHVAAFEINELFCKTLRRNRPSWKIFGPPTHSGDVSRFSDVADALSGVVRSPFEGLFVGGPPPLHAFSPDVS